MHGFKLLDKGMHLTQKIPLETMVYLFIISNALPREEILVSKYYEDAVVHNFSLYEEDEVLASVRSLEKYGLINITDEYIVIGSNIGGIKKLFGSNKIDISEDFDKLEEEAKSFSKISGLGKRIQKEIAEFRENYKKAGVPQFMGFYRMCYEAVYQEQHREFKDKEYGQMKTLVKMYETEMLIKMIIFFVLNCDKYPSTSLGLLLVKCDEVFSACNQLKGKKRKASYEREENDSF